MFSFVFSHIVIKKFIKQNSNSKFMKIHNNSTHIITSDINIIKKYQMRASLKTNIEIRMYNVNDNIKRIVCEYFIGNSENNVCIPESIFKNIDHNRIKEKYFEIKN